MNTSNKSVQQIKEKKYFSKVFSVLKVLDRITETQINRAIQLVSEDLEFTLNEGILDVMNKFLQRVHKIESVEESLGGKCISFVAIDKQSCRIYVSWNHGEKHDFDFIHNDNRKFENLFFVCLDNGKISEEKQLQSKKSIFETLKQKYESSDISFVESQAYQNHTEIKQKEEIERINKLLSRLGEEKLSSVKLVQDYGEIAYVELLKKFFDYPEDPINKRWIEMFTKPFAMSWKQDSLVAIRSFLRDHQSEVLAGKFKKSIT